MKSGRKIKINSIKRKITNESNKLKRTSVLFRGFYNSLHSVENNDLKSILAKTKRFMDVEVRSFHKKDGAKKFLPKFDQMEFVHCHFTGVGFEWDLPHYALIWDINPYYDSVMVIPTTSEPREERIDIFSVGKIQGLPKVDTYLLISDMTRVSRKRLEKITYIHEKKGTSNPRLPKVWHAKVLHGIAARYLNCVAFEEVIISLGVVMPDNLSQYKELRYKAIQKDFIYEQTTNILKFKFFDKSDFSELQLKMPQQSDYHLWKETKQKKIRALVSTDKSKKSLAEQFFKEIYQI